MKRYWLESLLIVATAVFMTATMCGCASRQAMNKMFFDLGKATGKTEAMK